MPARRTHRKHPRRQQFTPAAVATFKCLLETNDVAEQDLLLSQLADQLELLPWQGPAILHPDEECPYPRDTAAYDWWPQAKALYRAFTQAAAA